MNELYYREPYTAEFDADVVKSEKVEDHYETVLSDTAFYPEGGGQACDTGTLNDVKVYDVQNHDGTIIHYTKEPVNDPVVHGVIDWDRRFTNMQLHTADHIFSGLVHKHFKYDNVGFSMGEHGVRMDFNGPISQGEIRKLELEANQVIWNNLPIRANVVDSERLKGITYRSKKELTGNVRIVVIPGVDVCACCGTHVARTGEVGSIRIYSCEKYKEGVRVIMFAGKKALEEDNILTEQNHEISVALSAEPQKTYSAVKSLQDQLETYKKEINDLNAELLTYKINDFKEGSSLAVDFEKNADRKLMIRLANDLVDQRHVKTAAVMNQTDNGYAYVIISHSVDLKSLSKDLNASLNGRGGGKPDVIQGSFQADEETIRKVLNEMLGN